jgi:hypothetical protein
MSVDHQRGVENFSLQTYWGAGIVTGIAGYAMESAGSFIPIIGSFFSEISDAVYNLGDAIFGTNSQKVYDSTTGGDKGGGLALDIIGSLGGKAGEAARGLSDSMSWSGVATSDLPGAVKDAMIQLFLDVSIGYSILGNASNRDEAISLANVFAEAAVSYYTEGMAGEGVSKYDWAEAMEDTMRGYENDLYSEYMCD